MTAENRRILIIDDERTILLTLEALLGRHGYQPETAATASYGLRMLKSNPPAVVLLDLQLPDADGLQMLEQIKREHPETQVIILTAHDSLSNAIESIKRGAYHFISKPYAPEELLSLIEKALEKQSLLRETEHLREKTQQLEKRLEIAETRLAPVIKSKAMQEIQELVDAMAPSEANCPDHGRKRRGQGSDRERDSQPQPPRRETDGEAKLRRVSAGDDRVGIIRLRERRVHRRDE